MTIAIKDPHRTVMVRVRMAPAEVEALNNLAEERSCSVGAVLRWAVRTAVMNVEPRVREGEQA